MNLPVASSTRRAFLGTVSLGAAYFTVPGLFAEELARTPRMTEGPFYPPKLPLDKDNDLVKVGNSTTPAIGEITHLTGKVLDDAGNPLNDAQVEIWQCDAKQVYLAQGSRNDAGGRADPNFQGYGQFATSAKGEYYFRTIKPVAYPGRTPHIHVRVNKGGRELLTTQLFINGHPQNKSDGVFRGIRDPLARELVLVDFSRIKDSKIGELSATFDIVIGATPGDSDDAGPPRKGRR